MAGAERRRVGAGLEYRAGFQIQFHIAAQKDGAAAVHMPAGQNHPAAAVCRTGIQRFLNGWSIVGAAVAFGTVIQNNIFHRNSSFG